VTGSEEERAPVENFISMLEENPPPKNFNHAVRLKFIKSEELIKNLPPSVSKDNISESQDKALVFFTGSESQYADFLEDLKVIDRPKEQIEYKILVIQRQKTDGLNFGSNFTIDDDWAEDAYSTHSLTLSNIFNINFDIVGKFGHQFAGTLNAEISAGKSHVLADTTLNGISGETITFSNTNTYRYRDIIVDTGGDLYTSTTREISSGLVLSVNGWVSGDDMITVSVDAQVSKQGSSDSSSDTNNPPSTSEKKVKTNVRTRSGENVIIGGLYQTEKDVTEKRTPFLSRIPFIGFLFKSKSVSEAETEFVIYLVPSSHKESDGDFDEEKNIRRLFEKYVKGGSL
jgi:type II secretory pathway component GspD/PulD (secretin)